MHVVMLSDYETTGGAAIAASRLADGLISLGTTVTRIVHEPDGGAHPWKTIPCPQLTRGSIQPLAQLLAELRPDAINLHNLHGGPWRACVADLVGACDDLAPTCWTLHDTWSFTGRCAYPYDCKLFVSGCDASCPTPDEYPKLSPELIAPAWQARQAMFRRHSRLTAIAPSRWLAAEARKGFWRDHRVEVIPYDLPLQVYRPVQRAAARAQLGLPVQGPVAMVIAEHLWERRKGRRLLQAAFDEPTLPPLTLLTVGNPDTHQVFAPARARVHALGYTQEVEKIVAAYNAADVLLHPAPVDNFPNVILEALACGTPVVAFRTGGVPELVRDSETGWLAEQISSENLGRTLSSALTAIAAGKDLRRACRDVAEAEFKGGLQARRYLELFARCAR